MRILKLKRNVTYTPQISLWHPEMNVSTMDKKKLYAYAFGYGCVFRKNLHPVFLVILLMSICYQFGRLLLNICKLDYLNASKMFLGIKGRIFGFINYKKE